MLSFIWGLCAIWLAQRCQSSIISVVNHLYAPRFVNGFVRDLLANYVDILTLFECRIFSSTTLNAVVVDKVIHSLFPLVCPVHPTSCVGVPSVL
ncbi:hypothetical protein C8R45DRAFT_992425 [Mycena sanguinolenta]|nr:hypothetical protein C8R45DRAFT_1003042 [Mycena sanguinolenta]KAJ6490044.1 hypothetical protein C8R45DRAFT_992425 [Mycena sanguinolenta]